MEAADFGELPFTLGRGLGRAPLRVLRTNAEKQSSTSRRWVTSPAAPSPLYNLQAWRKGGIIPLCESDLRGSKNAKENLAAQSATPKAAARFPGAYEYQRGPQGPEIEASERAPQTVCVRMPARPVRREYRLRSNTDFQRIRREGRTFVQPLLVMATRSNDLDHSRVGFVVGRRIGKAVDRNRMKRRMRESIRLRVQRDEVSEGWDVVFIARHPMADASFHQVDEAIGLLLRRAGLVSEVA